VLEIKGMIRFAEGSDERLRLVAVCLRPLAGQAGPQVLIEGVLDARGERGWKTRTMAAARVGLLGGTGLMPRRFGAGLVGLGLRHGTGQGRVRAWPTACCR
jgi:hypothetical protein